METLLGIWQDLSAQAAVIGLALEQYVPHIVDMESRQADRRAVLAATFASALGFYLLLLLFVRYAGTRNGAPICAAHELLFMLFGLLQPNCWPVSILPVAAGRPQTLVRVHLHLAGPLSHLWGCCSSLHRGWPDLHRGRSHGRRIRRKPTQQQHGSLRFCFFLLSLSVCLSICLCICLRICLCICLCVWVSIHLSLFLRLSFCLSLFLNRSLSLSGILHCYQPTSACALFHLRLHDSRRSLLPVPSSRYHLCLPPCPHHRLLPLGSPRHPLFWRLLHGHAADHGAHCLLGQLVLFP